MVKTTLHEARAAAGLSIRTVAFDRTGARECYAYHAYLQKELRRVRNV